MRFVVAVALVVLCACSNGAVDLSRLYGLHNKREGNAFGEAILKILNRIYSKAKSYGEVILHEISLSPF